MSTPSPQPHDRGSRRAPRADDGWIVDGSDWLDNDVETLKISAYPGSAKALPFKLIFFVLVDGWSLVAGSLVQSYGG